MAVYFMSADWLKENSPIDLNVDDKTLSGAIKEAQEIHIRDIIGSGLYDDLITEVSGGSVSADNQTLLNNYIRPCLKYYAIVEAIMPMTFKLMNKAVGKRSADNFEPVAQGDMTLIEQRFRDKAEYYSNRLTDFLHENQQTYPLFLNPGSGIDVIRPGGVQLFGGFYLGDSGCTPYGYDGMPD